MEVRGRTRQNTLRRGIIDDRKALCTTRFAMQRLFPSPHASLQTRPVEIARGTSNNLNETFLALSPGTASSTRSREHGV